MVKTMRSGVTLFITLAIIAAMLGLLGVVFKYLETARTQAELKASLIQGNLLYADIQEAIRRLLGKKAKSSTYKTFYDTPLAISTNNGEFGAMIHCSPLADRPNISWLRYDGDKKHQAHYEIAAKIYDAITSKANLKNPSGLYDKIVDAIKSSKISRYGIRTNINKKKGTITRLEFQSIVDDYRYEEDDEKVYTIPWDTYFVFGHDMERIDSDFIAPEVLSAIFDIDLRLVQGNDGFERGDSLKNYLEENGLDMQLYNLKPPKEIFAKKHPIDAMSCSMGYSFRDGRYSFGFDYINKRVENFEFSGH